MEGPRLVPKWAFALCLSLRRQEGPNQPQGNRATPCRQIPHARQVCAAAGDRPWVMDCLSARAASYGRSLSPAARPSYQAGTNFPTQNDLGWRIATSRSWKAVTRMPPDLLNE